MLASAEEAHARHGRRRRADGRDRHLLRIETAQQRLDPVLGRRRLPSIATRNNQYATSAGSTVG
ncbi:MAG: hypothetical protein A3G21_13180 [Acidobacteria bacterium RIFCSPLOWO2_12_FULL_66_21]|nr:MAG: hypothetical protein A3G21_13180 [Acidobacteria bacterium RIFCSPLOWO2_12_FULL_66_21]